MRFIMPQFIERETKVVGPLTFKQSVIFGFVLVVLFFIYVKFSMPVFIIAFFLLFGLALALAFGKIKGVPVLEAILNFFHFSFSAKTFIWKGERDSISFEKREFKKEKEESLSVDFEGRLKNLKRLVETTKR